ncbi:MAG: hypothetical protein ACR2PM_01415 [Hyphomicrobiales bacterium]
MTRDTSVGEVAAAGTLLGIVLLNRPLIDLFNQGTTVVGIPTTVAYVFGAWAVLIGLLALTMRPWRPEQPKQNTDS